MTTMIMTRELSPGPQMLQRRAPSTAGSLASLRLITMGMMVMMVMMMMMMMIIAMVMMMMIIAMVMLMKAITMMITTCIMMTYIAVTLIYLPHQVADQYNTFMMTITLMMTIKLTMTII